MSGLCYRNSVQGRTDDLKEGLLIHARKEEQNEALDEARARNNAKRLEMEKKYPDLAKYNKNWDTYSIRIVSFVLLNFISYA